MLVLTRARGDRRSLKLQRRGAFDGVRDCARPASLMPTESVDNSQRKESRQKTGPRSVGVVAVMMTTRPGKVSGRRPGTESAKTCGVYAAYNSIASLLPLVPSWSERNLRLRRRHGSTADMPRMAATVVVGSGTADVIM